MVRTASGGGEGGSSGGKFVSVNLNKSYGLPTPPPASPSPSSSSSAASAAVRFSSRLPKQGGMVLLSRPGLRLPPATSTGPASSKSGGGASGAGTPKLAVPLPVNLPSLRSQHGGNDPSITLTGVGPAAATTATATATLAGWSRQPQELPSPLVVEGTGGSDVTGPGNRQRGDAYAPPGARRTSAATNQAPSPGSPLVLERASVVLKGEDFPTLKAAATPSVPLPTPPPQTKQQPKERPTKRKEEVSESTLPPLESPPPQTLKKEEPRSLTPSKSLDGSWRKQAPGLPPPPLTRLSRTSDWDDDERETSQTLLRPPKESHHPEDTLGGSSNSNRGGGGHSVVWSRSSSGGYGRDGKDENNSREPNGFDRGLDSSISSKEFGHPLPNRAAPKESGVGHFNRDYMDRTGEHRREGAAAAAHAWDGGFAKASSFNSSRYTAVRRESNGFDKHSSSDWLGKSAERFGSYVSHPSPTEKGRKAEFGKDARRASFAFDKPRVELSSFQNTDFAAGLRGGYGGSSMDPFGLDVKLIRKKREESERRNLRDPERESFEAELERVQSMLEQERRRVAEEQERAVEVARKEREERERLAKEEEELRLKMEEEAREAAAELEREAIEAAAKAERDRKAREEAKHKDLIEEERRKEAARRKLLELEERIAKRESERKREEEERKRRDESASAYDNQQSQDQATWEDKELHQHPFPITVSRRKQDDDNDHGDEREHFRESSDGTCSRPTSSETMPYSADYRVDQADVLGSQSLSSQRRSRVENERHGFQAPSVLKSLGQNDFGTNSNNKWRPNRGLPSREAAPNAVSPHPSQESSQWESFVRRSRLPDSNEQRQNVKKDPYNSSLTLSEEDPSSHMLGSSYEREGDCEWDTTNGLNSFSLSPYLRGVDSIDSLTTGRARLSLPKQPRVPPPPVIQAPPWRPQPRVEEQPLASAHTEVSVAKPSGYEVSSPLNVGSEDKEVEKALQGVGGIEQEEEIWEASEPDSQRVSPEVDSDNNEEVIDNPPCDIRTDGGDEVPGADSGELQTSWKGERSDGMDYEEDWGVEEGGVDDYDADLGEEEEDEEEEEDREIEGVEDFIKPSHDYEEDKAADVSEREYEEGNTDDEEEGGNEVENKIGEVSLPHLNEDSGKEMEKSCISEEVRDEVGALNLGLPLFSDSIGSVEAMGNVGPVRHSPLGQQFQAPFSFMAVPLPQSNSSNAPPSLLPPPPSNPVPNPGLPTQPDIPFQLHFGLLPGAPLLPSAIQIGSIQMPLHLHPPVPQLTAHHLHTSQPPLFQFGQIGHSGPFAQPPPTMFPPPSMHIHHPMSQPPPQTSHPQPAFNHSDASMHPSPNEDIQFPSPNENAPTQNQDPMPLEDSSSNSAEPSLALLSNPQEVPVDVLVKDTNQECFQVNDHPPLEQFAGKESRSSRSSGGGQFNNVRRRGSSSGYRGGLAPSGRGGRGGGRFGNTNNGYETWGFENNGRKTAGGTGERFVRNRPPRRSFRRAEFKVKEPYSQNPSDIPGIGRQQQQWEEENYPQTSSNLVVPYSDFRDSQFNQGGRTTNRRSSAIDERTYNGGAYYNSRVDQSGGRNSNHAGIMKPPTKAVGMPSNHPSVVRSSVKATNSGISSNRRFSDSKNHVVREAYSDAPLQSGVVHVFEQPGIEIPNNDDDFIEVRSKRQMLNDKREQREKEIKSRNKEAKLSEHGLRKQQRVSKSTQQVDTTAPEINSAQSGEKQLSLQNSDMETVNIDARQPAPTSMSQAWQTSTVQQPLAPIGTPASASSDAPEIKAKGPRPVHANPLPGSNQVSTDGPTSEIHASMRDKAVNPISAWGGQRPTCQPVSLTQIQLEEVMKPRFEGPLSQQRSSSERPIRAIESTGIPAVGMISHEKVTATVPGPVASLLAGEKIQFGAVTSPPIILPSTQSHTPSMPPAVGSSLNSDVKSTVGPVENSPFPSRGKRARGNEEKSRDAADVEAEAAASAVAAAVISSDEFNGSACPSDSRSSPLVRVVTPVSGSSFAKPDGCSTDVSGVATTLPSGSLVPAVEDSVALSLPADLSVEGPPLMLRGPLHGGQGSSGLMLPPLSGVLSPFPCLEMGPMLSGPPFFSLAPSEDALSMPQGMKQACTLPGMGPAGVSWPQRHSTGVDSFYSGQPSVFPGPFIGPAGGVPGIQGPAHMLVYTNPFASVGQYGQLGVSFMGTTYLPSGKQPDWKHTPILTSSPGESHLSEGDMGGNSLGGMISQPGSTSVVNPAQQHVGLSASSVMPVSPPLSLFDLSLSAPFQMPNTETMTESQWPYVPQSVPISGPVMGHLMQSWNFGGLPNQMPPLSQMMAQGNSPGLRSIPSPKPTANNNNNTLATDAAARFPNELGLDASSLPSNMASLATVGSRLPMPSKESTAPSPISTTLNSSKLPRHRRPLRGTRGTDLADNANNPSLDVVGMVSSNGSTPNVGHNKAMGGASYDEGRFASQQGGTVRAGVGNEWPSSGTHHRKGMGGGGGRAPSIEKPFALPSKMKQVYVAKAVAPPLPPRVESSQQDTPGNVFSL